MFSTAIMVQLTHNLIGNQPIFLKDWAAQGITKVKHLLKENSKV